jgi:hypothetical protein
MKSKTIVAFTFVFTLGVAASLLPTLSPQLHAQQGCASLRALGHGILPTNHPINVETDTWGGDVWGTLGSEFLTGVFSGNDGTYFEHKVSNQATNGHYVFVFGADSFTFEVAHATFNFPLGQAGFGQYRGHGNIVGRSGRFQYASGSIDWEAPFIAWPSGETGLNGRANFTITGTICGIQ